MCISESAPERARPRAELASNWRKLKYIPTRVRRRKLLRPGTGALLIFFCSRASAPRIMFRSDLDLDVADCL
jgi:hypothetical protein